MNTHKWSIMMLLKSHDIHFWVYSTTKLHFPVFKVSKPLFFAVSVLTSSIQLQLGQRNRIGQSDFIHSRYSPIQSQQQLHSLTTTFFCRCFCCCFLFVLSFYFWVCCFLKLGKKSNSMKFIHPHFGKMLFKQSSQNKQYKCENRIRELTDTTRTQPNLN